MLNFLCIINHFVVYHPFLPVPYPRNLLFGNKIGHGPSLIPVIYKKRLLT